MSESDGHLSADDVDDIVRQHENEEEAEEEEAANIDDGLGVEANDGNEQVQDISMQGAIDGGDDNDDGDATGAVKPDGKKRAVRKLVVLNTERLKGPKGVHTIEKLYEGFQFRGKGHEKEDLDRVMKRLEYWAFRLYPKLEFDDFLAKCEHLGHKKDLMTHMKKYRLGMITADDKFGEGEDIIPEIEDDEQEEDDVDAARAERERLDRIADENFDRLLAETVEGPNE